MRLPGRSPSLLSKPLLTTALLVAALGTGGRAQGPAASRNFFLQAGDCGPALVGGQSANWRVDATLGSGHVSGSASSASWRLEASWLAVQNNSLSAAPWIVSASPRFAPIGGGTAHKIHGTNLLQGPLGCSVGGVASTVGSTRQDELSITLGQQNVPGWQPVVVQRGSVSSVLERGIGIEPMLELQIPFARDRSRANEIVYHGTMGDAVVWMLSVHPGTAMFPLPGYGHGFGLDLATLFILVTTPVTSPDGVLRFPLPPIRMRPPLYVQGLVIAPLAPYAPGSFTNVQQL